MEPGKQQLDLNSEIQKRCVEIFRGNFGKEYHLSIIASTEIKMSSDEIVKAYENILATVEKLAQRKFPKKNFQLIVIYFDKRPKNYIYNVRNINSQESTLVILEGNSNLDRTNEIICELEAFGPHEFFHTSVRWLYPGVKSGKLCGAGWFEEGLACYCNYLSDFYFSQCKEKRTQSDGNIAMVAFTNNEIRQDLWKNFSPGNESWLNRNKFKKMTEEEIKAFWKPLDDGLDASLGAFIFLERRIGKDKLFEIVHNLQGKHEYQDEKFYQDLASYVGFDIRKVTQQEIEEVFADNK